MTKGVIRNPDWTEDEHILALDYYLSCKPGHPQKGDKGIVELSRLLTKLHSRLGTKGDPRLRNPDGVYMKCMSLKAHDPESVARGRKGLSRGNRLEAQVWAEFGDDQPRLHQAATAIRSFIESSQPLTAADDADNDDALAPEGRVLTAVHRRYERNPRNRRRKLSAFTREHGRPYCECCGFDFALTYGSRGDGFIEIHHEFPVSRLTPERAPRLRDLRLVCANCHRMIHRAQPWLSVDGLCSALKRRGLGPD